MAKQVNDAVEVNTAEAVEVNAAEAVEVNAETEIRSIIEVAKDYGVSSANAAAEQDKACITARDLSDRCRAELGDRWIGINFNSARASKAGDHASSLGMTLDQLKLAIEIKDAFDASITKVLKSKGFSCLLYTSPSPRDRTRTRMPSSA